MLSQLALRGYDANMTLGRTKSVDILVSDPKTNRLYQLEVKTNLDSRKRPTVSKVFGRFLSSWIMHEQHELISRPELWYCFVMIGKASHAQRFFIVPSRIVAKYIRDEHRAWLNDSPERKSGTWREFRIGLNGESYRFPTPTTDAFEDNWEFKDAGK